MANDKSDRAALRHRPGGARVPLAAAGRASSRSSPTKPMATQRDLSLAYSPGVAVPVQAIADDPEHGLRLHRQAATWSR